MAFRKHRKSIIDRKLSDIDREIARLNRDMKTFSRSRGLKQFNQPPNPETRRQPANDISANQPENHIASTDIRQREISDNDSHAPAVKYKTKRTGGGANPESDSRANKTGHTSGLEDGRDKFVNYFAAGNFKDLRPARQSEAVLRNKAIMMAILAVLAAFGLLFHFLGR